MIITKLVMFANLFSANNGSRVDDDVCSSMICFWLPGHTFTGSACCRTRRIGLDSTPNQVNSEAAANQLHNN
jgi:hypothetical protein